MFRLTRPRSVLTPRGWVVFLLALYLVLGPGKSDADIVASAFGLAMLSALILLSICVFVEAALTRRGLQTGFSVPERLVSGAPQHCALSLNPFRLLPFLTVQLRLTFKRQGPHVPMHVLSGRWDAMRFILEPLTFPHRGQWELLPWHVAVADRLGFTAWRWEMDMWDGPAVVTVFPPEVSAESLPMLSSAVRSGEDVIDQHAASGEPFDLKPYHPSDGMKKIVWKVFAKTGQLISRHPERAMTPEGRAVLFCLAGPSDDAACGLMLDYCRRAEALDLALVIGASGMGESPIATSGAQAETLLLDSVWASQSQLSEQEFEHFWSLAEAHLKGGQCTRILVFSTYERLSSATGATEMAHIGTTLQRRGAEPVFFVTQSGTESNWQRTPLAQRFLYGEERPYRIRAEQNLLSLCAQKGWTLHTVGQHGAAGRA